MVFFTNYAQFGPNRGSVISTAWSQAKVGAPFLAVATTGGSVSVFNKDGEPLDKNQEPLIQNPRGGDASTLAWHPIRRLLAIGWKDGGVSLWNQGDMKLKDDTRTHKGAITTLAWSPDGTRLISGDSDGKVGTWKTDTQMRPVPVVQYHERDSSVTSIAFDTKRPSPEGEKVVTFYYALVHTSGKGAVFFGDDKGHKGHLFDVDSELMALLFSASKGSLVGISRQSIMTVHERVDEEWSNVIKMKLPLSAGDGPSGMHVSWAGEHVLAMASEKDFLVRMFDLETEENFVLSMGESAGQQRITSLAFNTNSQTLCAGTHTGHIALWRYVGEPEEDVTEAGHEDISGPEKSWVLEPGADLASGVSELSWGPYMKLLSAVHGGDVAILTRAQLQHRIRDKIAAVQLSPESVMVDATDGSQPVTIQTKMQVTGLDCTDTNLVVWDGRTAEVYDIAAGEATPHASFPTDSACMSVYRDSVYRCTPGKVEVCNFGGTVKQTLVFDDVQGKPAQLDINGDFLAVSSSNNYIRLWKISGREAKPHGLGRRVEVQPPIGEIESIRCNCNGTRVSFLATAADSGKRDPRLFVYDVDADGFMFYDFGAEGRMPEVHLWDGEEPKLLACESVRMKVARDPSAEEGAPPQEGKKRVDSGHSMEVTTLFSTPNDGVLVQERQKLAADQGLLGVRTPHLYFYHKPFPGRPHAGTYVHRSVMRDFTGMDGVDDKTRKALLNFSYHLAIGNMDEAYKAVKLISNPSVWENMAYMCIKTKRLDVVEHCLGNMGHARGARAVRESAHLLELDARVAAVAVQLNLLEDAAKLYVACERWDLLNNLHQACGEWEKALSVAEKHDRIHLRSTHYSFAKHLESVGDLQGAIAEYEKADTAQHEVPRMLYQAQQLGDLEAYIEKTEDRELTRWWAQYCESAGMADRALQCYQDAGDHLALVRVHCNLGDFEAATDIAKESGDPAAAFHLARHYEAQERVAEAVQYYARAQRYSHAVRLAKKNGMDNDLLNLALQSTKRVMIDTAQYFEAKGGRAVEKAVLLYQKGGKPSHALELCFAGNHFEALKTIAGDLDGSADPALVARCGDFFMQHGQYDKAAHLLVAGKQYVRALDLCMEHNIEISEEMAEAMTPEKTAANAEERAALLRRIAKCCKRQGQYHLACKKYTQAGDKLKAMKVLIKSGDTERITFFAGVSRQREIYIMAANYLQTLDWHNDQDIMKNIIQFYTKARAPESLASFYEACAQIEIDEFRSYEKALGALRSVAENPPVKLRFLGTVAWGVVMRWA